MLGINVEVVILLLNTVFANDLATGLTFLGVNCYTFTKNAFKCLDQVIIEGSLIAITDYVDFYHFFI